MAETSIPPSHGTNHGECLHSLLLQYSKKGAHDTLEVQAGCSFQRQLIQHLLYVTNFLMLQTFPSDSLAITSQKPLVAVLTAKSAVTEQQGKGNRLSGSVRHVKWLCVYTRALNATIPSSITSRFQQILYTHQVHTNLPLCIYFHNYSKVKLAVCCTCYHLAACNPGPMIMKMKISQQSVPFVKQSVLSKCIPLPV